MSGGPDAGETVEIDDGPEPDVVDTPDGGAIVKVDEEEKPGDSQFYANLCNVVGNTDQQSLATALLELIEEDKTAREKRDEQYEEGLRRTGLGDDAPGGAQFQGASRVVHPMLTESSVDFASRAIKELFPPNGPAKSKILGRVTKDRAAKATRKADFMNWQLTVQCKGMRQELEQLLTQVPLGGAQYLQVTWDQKRNRPRFLFVPIDEMYLPFAATSFYTAERKTRAYYITQQTYLQRVADGVYADVDLTAESMVPERSKAARANDKIEGKDDSALNRDGLRLVYEVYVCGEYDWDDRSEGGFAPYIVTVDKATSKVLAIYRNWDEDDASRDELQWIVEFPFVPWRGPYPIGLTQMIGGLSGAATGALRALLDSAHISNSQAMIKLKGGVGGQSLEIQPTQIMEIEGGVMSDDIRKLAMPLPYNQPSGVLFELLGFLVTEGKGVVRTTLENAPDSNPDVPVGTTLANIEQGMVVFNAIHARMHEAVMMVLVILHRLNGLYLDDKETQSETGDLIASRRDFQGPMDVVPVSDPNIFSEAQRFAQVQAVAQRAQLNPDLYDRRSVEERILQTLKIPDPLGLLKPKATPERDNAVSENVKAALGKAIVAFPDEDHVAHLAAHVGFMVSPAFGKSQLIGPKFVPIMLDHIREHVVLWYASQAFDVARTAAHDTVDMDFEHMMAEAKTVEEKKALDQVIAGASQTVVAEAPKVFESLQPVIAEAMQMMAAMQSQPQDPAAQVALEDVKSRERTAQAKLAADQQTDAGKQALDKQKLDSGVQTEAQKLVLQEQAQRDEDERAAAELATRERLNTQDNETDIELAEMHAEAHPHAATEDA